MLPFLEHHIQITHTDRYTIEDEGNPSKYTEDKQRS